MSLMQLLASFPGVSISSELLNNLKEAEVITEVHLEGKRVAEELTARQRFGYTVHVRHSRLGRAQNIRVHYLEVDGFLDLCLGEDGVVYRLHDGIRRLSCRREPIEYHDATMRQEILESIRELVRV